MSHKKGQGSTRNGRDSNPKYLGVKAYGGEKVKTGCILIRQSIPTNNNSVTKIEPKIYLVLFSWSIYSKSPSNFSALKGVARYSIQVINKKDAMTKREISIFFSFRNLNNP